MDEPGIGITQVVETLSSRQPRLQLPQVILLVPDPLQVPEHDLRTLGLFGHGLQTFDIPRSAVADHLQTRGLLAHRAIDKLPQEGAESVEVALHGHDLPIAEIPVKQMHPGHENTPEYTACLCREDGHAPSAGPSLTGQLLGLGDALGDQITASLPEGSIGDIKTELLYQFTR